MDSSLDTSENEAIEPAPGSIKILPDDVVKDAEQIIDMLELMFDAYENGIDCYEDPENNAGYVGKAFRLDDEDFKRIADFLNAKRPRNQGGVLT